jgi:2-polyprenyl-6-methoxyphenol hydroxylase-like FAD-dependent oxidoreductase
LEEVSISKISPSLRHDADYDTGLAGLATAHGLKKSGISCTLYERETVPRDRNWGVTISWAHPLMEQLLPESLYATLPKCQPDPSLDTKAANKECVLVRDGSTGEKMVEPHFPGVRRVNIRKTKTVWREGLDVQYGKKVVGIEVVEDGVKAKFEDGTESERADVIMGADGGGSYVRKFLLGEDAKQEVLPYTFMNFAFTLKAKQALWLDGVMNPNVDVATHPKNMYLGIFLLDKRELERPETWVYYLLVTWPTEAGDEDTETSPEASKRRLERLRAKMEGWADPYKSVVEWLPEDVQIQPDQLRIWHPKPWDSHGGRVTLSGDAAHRHVSLHPLLIRLRKLETNVECSMTFHRGQGGNLAIKDAMEFVNELKSVQAGDKTLKEAMKSYDAGVVERGEEVGISKSQAVAFHDYANFRNSPIFKMGLKPN